MRRVGESVYYKEFLKPQLNEIVGEESYKLEHIVGRRKLVTHTDRVDDSQLEAVTALLERVLPQNVEVVRYNHHIEVSWREINKYVKCDNLNDFASVNPEYRQDLTSDGWWVYPLKQHVLRGDFLSGSNVTHYAPERFPSYTATDFGAFANCKKLKRFDAEYPNKLLNGVFSNCTSLEIVTTDFSHAFSMNQTFANCRNLRTVTSSFPNVTWCYYTFSGTQLDKESAIRFLDSIPVPQPSTPSITIGIHIDHQTDEEVLAAIANAEAKGWTLIVQWNGTPTTQASVTYALRKPPIYAKLGEMERPDGTIERMLDWGHYVTNPEDYQEFSSLEEAREYFGISDQSEELNNSEQ